MSNKSDLLVAAEVLERESRNKNRLYDEVEVLENAAGLLRILQEKSAQPLPIDWGDPEILKKLERFDKKKHNFCRVLCSDAAGDFPVKLLSIFGAVCEFKLNGTTSHVEGDLIPITPKVVRKTVYVSNYLTGTLQSDNGFYSCDGFPSPRGVYKNLVTIEFEVTNE